MRALALVALLVTSAAEARPRARQLGIPFAGTPGTHNAITDVAGVEVGYTTIIRGQGARKAGEGPVRTGVTVIFPRGQRSLDSVMAASAPLNGNGEVTGLAWVDEGGFLDGPIALTNTHSVGLVRDAIIAWEQKTRRIPTSTLYTPELFAALPVVGETADVTLNDMNGPHVTPQHVFAALDGAAGGAIAEGNVGGGTGMICFGWKGGTGTASRRVGAYTVGVLVQANHGDPEHLIVAGVPVGETLRPPRPRRPAAPTGSGSILVVVATDAPLLPHQLERLARRGFLGIARTGSVADNGSGDFVIAFSTANPGVITAGKVAPVLMLPNEELDPLFAATVQATDEAIVNALIAAETMTGADDITIPALPHDALRALLGRHGRLGKASK